MALKELSTNYYIKIDLTGEFSVYKSIQDRKLEKKATSFKRVVLTYKTILKQLENDRERLYYDPDFPQIIKAWHLEYEDYVNTHINGIGGKKFPLIKQYIKDVEKSLPEIVYKGCLGVTGVTVKDVYEYAKTQNFFGDTEDC